MGLDLVSRLERGYLLYLHHREAIRTFRQSPDQGFAKLQEIVAVREVPYLERSRAVADVYREMTANSGRSVLVVAATHEEVGRVTHAIREDQKQHGQLSGGVVLDRNVPLQWTEAQKKDIANYQPGQVLLVSPSHVAKVRLGLPLAVVERWFPALYPASSYLPSPEISS